MKIHTLNALEDNYIYFLFDEKSNSAAVVDPADAEPVEDALRKYSAKLSAILNTHHHWDHCNGNKPLLEKYSGIPVFAGEKDKGRIHGQTHFLKDGDTISLFGETADVIFIPGHTYAHTAFYFRPTNKEPGHLFCGDTLFGAGCGKLFEGTFEQMLGSLKRLRTLPPNTQIWCGHEYTEKNLRITLMLDPTNEAAKQRLEKVTALRRKNLPTVPLSLAEECETNPFLRWDNPELQRQTNTVGNELATFTYVREYRDRF